MEFVGGNECNIRESESQEVSGPSMIDDNGCMDSGLGAIGGYSVLRTCFERYIDPPIEPLANCHDW